MQKQWSLWSSIHPTSFIFAKSRERISKVLPDTIWQAFEPIVLLKRASRTTSEQDHNLITSLVDKIAWVAMWVVCKVK